MIHIWLQKKMKNKLRTFIMALALSIATLGSANANNVKKLPNHALKYSVETTATKDTIWHLWTDVDNWKAFDTLLEYSYLNDENKFKLGATGYLKAKGGLKTKFEVTAFDEDKSFILSLKLPLLQAIELERRFEDTPNTTTLTHQVNFKGGLKLLTYAALGKTFEKELTLVMGRLKALAESQ